MLRRLTRSRLPALAVALALLAPAGARAGNDDGVLLGNEAAMSAGAVTAIVNDGSATWYNPAGIAAVDRDTLDLSGSATMLRIADTPALLQSAATGATANGGYYEFLGIPSAVTLVRRLDRTTAFSLGIFVPQLTGHTDRVSLAEVVDRPAPDPDYASRWQLTQQESSSTYYGGLTLGIALLPNVRVGFTLFGTYRSAAFSTQFAGGVTVDDAPFEAIGLMSMETLQSVSLEIGAGLQWDIMPGLTLGLAARTPGLMVGSLYRLTTTTIASDPDGLVFAPTDEGMLRPQLAVVTPARVRLGIAYRWAEGWVGIEGDFQHELRSPEVGIDREWVGGVRVGGRYWVDPQISIGAGLFTDLDATRTITGYGDTQLDFFGGTFGVEVRNPHRLGEGENASDIVFVNTFALRYAAGFGQIGGLRFSLPLGAEGAVEDVAVATQVHEISLHLGSALYF